MNLFLTQNTSHKVVLTLQENSQLWIYSGIQPYYLFEFSSPTTNSSFYFVSDNIAPLSARNSYDAFIFTCTGASQTNFSAGTIHINPGMFWNYRAFEQTTKYNFNPAATVSEVENGKVQYSAVTQDFTYSSYTANTDTYYTYNTQN